MAEKLYLDKRVLVNGDTATKTGMPNPLSLKDYVEDVAQEVVAAQPIEFYPSGTAAAPSITFTDDTDTGIYLGGNNILDFSVNGTRVLDLRISQITADGTLRVNGPLKMVQTPQTLTGAGAVDLTTFCTLLVTTGANALTLAAGSEGQFKFIKMKTDGGDGTLTVTNLQGGTTITFDDAGDFVYLFYQDAKWNILTNSGCTVA